MSSLIKEIISLSNIYFIVMKNLRFQNFNFIEKEIWRNALPLKSKKVQGIIAETFNVASSSAVFRLQNRVSDFF